MFAIDLPQRADAFRRLHQREAGSILVLPNAWDAMSARVIEEAGARAIATTSAGVAWALGRADGEGLTRDQMINAIERIARVVRVPVTADVERGYGDGTPADVAETVRRVIGAGAVGINLEDAPGRDGATLMEVDEQGERIAAAREAASGEGVELFINARVDAVPGAGGAAGGPLRRDGAARAGLRLRRRGRRVRPRRGGRGDHPRPGRGRPRAAERDGGARRRAWASRSCGHWAWRG